MFIVWGRQVNRKQVGYVADFCPMCRGPQVFLMNSVSAHRHVYFVPIGDKNSGYERVCDGCKVTLFGTPKFFKASRRKPTSVQEIVQSSFPSFNEVYADRLRIEDAVRRDPGKLPQNVRAALLRQPFSVVSPLVQARFRQQSRLDVRSVLALILALVSGFVAMTVAEMLHSDYAGTTFLAVVGLGAVFFLWTLTSEPRRYLKRFITPQLAKTLGPLQPSESELATVLAELRQSKQRLGRHLRATHLMKAIAEV